MIKIIPTANSVEDAKSYIRKLYGTTEGTFTGYEFAFGSGKLRKDKLACLNINSAHI